MRIRRYEPYEEPQPRRPWTREELRDAGLPAPACLPALPGVGRRIAAMILDCWHELDAAGDMAASGPVSTRRPWTAEELAETLDACRRMGAMETRLGRPMDEDEAGDVICETACRLGRRWSETRRVMSAVSGLVDGPVVRCLQDVKPAVLVASEATALARLRRENGRKEG